MWWNHLALARKEKAASSNNKFETLSSVEEDQPIASPAITETNKNASHPASNMKAILVA